MMANEAARKVVDEGYNLLIMFGNDGYMAVGEKTHE